MEHVYYEFLCLFKRLVHVPGFQGAENCQISSVVEHMVELAPVKGLLR